MESLREIICKNFNRLVDSSDLSKREIARIVGVSEASLQRWKSGVNSPEVGNIEALADALKVSPLEFYHVSEAPQPIKLPISKVLGRLSAIPDDVYDLAEGIPHGHPMWKGVKLALEAAREVVEKEKKEKSNRA